MVVAKRGTLRPFAHCKQTDVAATEISANGREESFVNQETRGARRPDKAITITDRYHESPHNVAAADIYFDYAEPIVRKRKAVKRQTMEQRRLQRAKATA